MIVKVLFFGVLKDLTGLSEDEMVVPPGATVASVFTEYSRRFETLEAVRPSILFACNQEFVDPATTLSDRDEVAFLPPVSGGSGASGDREREFFLESRTLGHLFALTRQTIDSRSLAQGLQRPEDGAAVVFEGIVRNNTKGRPTTFLEYECYEQMALQQMERIGLEIASSHAIGRIAMVHRLGRLEIGEASVAIIATAPHRKAAFQAALEGIDRLKREVPIWKKEHFEDGAVWVEGEWDDKLRGQQAAVD